MLGGVTLFNIGWYTNHLQAFSSVQFKRQNASKRKKIGQYTLKFCLVLVHCRCLGTDVSIIFFECLSWRSPLKFLVRMLLLLSVDMTNTIFIFFILIYILISYVHSLSWILPLHWVLLLSLGCKQKCSCFAMIWGWTWLLLQIPRALTTQPLS